jgi:hypothetical protein
MPAHARDLLDWVSLFLFGIYYQLNPAIMQAHLRKFRSGPS